MRLETVTWCKLFLVDHLAKAASTANFHHFDLFVVFIFCLPLLNRELCATFLLLTLDVGVFLTVEAGVTQLLQPLHAKGTTVLDWVWVLPGWSEVSVDAETVPDDVVFRLLSRVVLDGSTRTDGELGAEGLLLEHAHLVHQ